MSFNDYLLSKGYSSTSTNRYQRDVDLLTRWLEQENIPVETCVYADVLHYVQHLKKTVTQRTVAMSLNGIKHYFDYLVETRTIIENPAQPIQIKGVKRRTLYDIITKQELESIYNNFSIDESQSISLRNKVMLGMMVYQGLTTKELNKLPEKNLKLREGKLIVDGDRKSNGRVLQLEAQQIMDMMEYNLRARKQILDQCHKSSELLLVSGGSSDSMKNAINMLVKKLKGQYPKITSLQQIRASVITHWLKIHNLRKVQYMAGHRYISSTEAFLVNDLEDLQEDINKYHPIG